MSESTLRGWIADAHYRGDVTLAEIVDEFGIRENETAAWPEDEEGAAADAESDIEHARRWAGQVAR